ncbi:MAG TPA: acyl carrier protein [Polyangiaceae bacterium]|jgi:acyl carrier protein
MNERSHGGQAVDVPSRVRQIVADTLQRPVGQIPIDAKLESGLGIDSMAMIDIGVSIEEEFEIALPPDLAERVRVETVGDLVRVVEGQLTARGRN